MEKQNQQVKVVKVTLERRIPLVDKTCPQCGTSFLGPKNKRYCSRPCVRKASYWRNPEGYRQKRLESYQRQKEQAAKK